MEKHERNKKKFKLLGSITLTIGICFTIIGFISFFSSFNSFEPPKYFWCCFIGFPLIGFGASLLALGYRKEVMRYMKNESLPIYKETYQEIKPELKETINIIKGNGYVICHFCQTENDANSKYCKKCGGVISEIRCPHCNSLIDSDSTFCNNCGKRL